METSVAALPAVARHEGPPVHVGEHARSFYETYADDESVYGPFVDGDRYVVERDRSFADAAAFLRSSELFGVGLGARVETRLREGYEVLVGPAVAELCPEFGRELADYFHPEP